MRWSLRALLRAGVVLLLSLAGAAGILLVLSGLDASPVSSPADPGQAGPPRAAGPPGVLPTSGAHGAARIARDEAPISNDALVAALASGDVVFVYGSGHAPPALRALARALAPPFSPALAAAGGAVILTPRSGTAGVIALAWRRQLRTARTDDPALRDFADFWLGRGSGGPSR